MHTRFRDTRQGQLGCKRQIPVLEHECSLQFFPQSCRHFSASYRTKGQPPRPCDKGDCPGSILILLKLEHLRSVQVCSITGLAFNVSCVEQIARFWRYVAGRIVPINSFAYNIGSLVNSPGLLSSVPALGQDPFTSPEHSGAPLSYFYAQSFNSFTSTTSDALTSSLPL